MCARFPDTGAREVGRGATKRSSPSPLSLGVAEHRSRQVKPRGVHIGGGVRLLPEAPPLFQVPEVVPYEELARLSPRKGACVCARSIRNTTSRRDEDRFHSRR